MKRHHLVICVACLLTLAYSPMASAQAIEVKQIEAKEIEAKKIWTDQEVELSRRLVAEFKARKAYMINNYKQMLYSHLPETDRGEVATKLFNGYLALNETICGENTVSTEYLKEMVTDERLLHVPESAFALIALYYRTGELEYATRAIATNGIAAGMVLRKNPGLSVPILFEAFRYKKIIPNLNTPGLWRQLLIQKNPNAELFISWHMTGLLLGGSSHEFLVSYIDMIKDSFKLMRGKIDPQEAAEIGNKLDAILANVMTFAHKPVDKVAPSP